MERTESTHSIANISEAIRSHLHRDSLTSLGGRLNWASRTNSPLKNSNFESISSAVVHLFQKKKLQENELASLQENIRCLKESEAGPLIYDFYKDKLIKKGMVILREVIKLDTGAELLSHLGDQWDYFYREILPVLQAILYPIKTKSLTIRDVTLLEFRDTVLMKLPVADAIEHLEAGQSVSPALQQMLLVLAGVREWPCSNNSILLEKLVARVTSPYLGMLGVYNGGTEPDIRSNFKPPKFFPLIASEPTFEITSESDEETTQCDKKPDGRRSRREQLSPLVLNGRINHKRNSGLLHHPLLAAVKEQDRGSVRRYSIATS